MRKVQVVVEFGGGPYFSGFNPPMIGRRIIDIIGFFSVPEEKYDVLQECRLVCLGGEVIVGLTISDEVVSDIALG